jgi:hypothetical protein
VAGGGARIDYENPTTNLAALTFRRGEGP